ncbi:uncharacterized protein DUF1794 [Barrientosiimonas humi]|uniref:Ferric nitrobindin-like protein n=1 Tax=Barrientosiimonas humi TaxID=999931 RepID=A0A542XF41_9MICO|nr:FABP family protein [Barrientosiimonas humi]TQL34430.1 uncharacterized protein DUF1794 [Barrientosiimonas humi]
MPFELDPDLPPALAPLAWLVGRWEGRGVLGYPGVDSVNFVQEIECRHDKQPFLSWSARMWEVGDDGERGKPLATELGFWRPLPDNEVELLLAHPTGVVEMYVGTTEPAKAQLQTDAVVRSPQAEEYTAATRLYGYVHSNLMWAMDMAAKGQPLQTYASAELQRAQ